MSENAKVYQLIGERELVVEQEQLVDVTAGMVRAKTQYSAISPGTEVAAYRGAPPLRPMNVYPRLQGYCNVAEVVEIGANVDGLSLGDLVYSHQSHRSDFVCDQSRLVPLPKGCNPAMMSTTYLFHLGYSALLKGNYVPGESVAVIGLGALGLTSVAMGCLFGANVVGLSNLEEGRACALQMGAHAVVEKSIDVARKALLVVSHGVGADLVVLTSSSWDDYRFALEIVRSGGRICMLGFPGREEQMPPFNPLDSRYFFDKQLTICTCGRTPCLDADPQDIRHTWKRNLEFLMGKINSGELDPTPIMSKIVPWNELESVYCDMVDRTPGLVTAILNWSR